MQQIALPGTGKLTSRLGFGCSGLVGGLESRESLRLLEAAYGAGIRHFDTAPSYGLGTSERCVGKFASRHAGEVTITTKYGLPRPGHAFAKRLVRGVVRPMVKSLPMLRRAASTVASAPVGIDVRPELSVSQARISLEQSRAQLKVDFIDILLLHEASGQDLNVPGLREYLQELVDAGHIGAFGVGATVNKIPALYRERKVFCDVLQYEWSVTDPVPDYPGSFRIHHRALSSHFVKLRAWFQVDKATCHQWSDSVGMDLGGHGLASLMLVAALQNNPECMILFSSRSTTHIERNVAVSTDPLVAECARRFNSLFSSGLGTSLQKACRYE